MSAVNVLKQGEKIALSHNQIISHVTGKTKQPEKKSKAAIGATGFITLLILVFVVFFGLGNFIPTTILAKLIEQTDVQYADAVESKKIAFQQALREAQDEKTQIPENTIKRLNEHGVEVGYLDTAGDFVAASYHPGGVGLQKVGAFIPADDFIQVINKDYDLYESFKEATYKRTAYYYDPAAKKVFRRLGINRNNYTQDLDYNQVMETAVGKGSNISINGVLRNQNQNAQNGENFTTNGNTAQSKTTASQFIQEVGGKFFATSQQEATLSAADTLKAADTISKEQRSSKFFVALMENVDKMKAGEGNDSRIHEVMDYLHQATESTVVDVETGELIYEYGAPLESPSLYAVLSDTSIDPKLAQNYSSDRILKTTENLTKTKGEGVIPGTITSASTKVTGSIGRFLNFYSEGASLATLEATTPTIESSLIDNSFESINGIRGGEFLVEGAVNLGKELAKASGATPGDATAVKQYGKLTNSVLAMDAAVDRLNRSPFDITSKNTFLGSIVFNLAVTTAKFNGMFAGLKTMAGITNYALHSLLPNVYAEGSLGYLENFGDCATIQGIAAEGSLQCTEIATFDTSTLDDPFNNPEFKAFVEKNTTLGATGTRTINNDSVLGDFIRYNNERLTPVGIMDGGILNSLLHNSTSIAFVSDIVGMIENFLGASEEHRRIASGAAFVNTASNPDWQEYKYAQRYVSIARAVASLRQYSNNKTAYTNLRYFEGEQDPVTAFLESYDNLANQ